MKLAGTNQNINPQMLINKGYYAPVFTSQPLQNTNNSVTPNGIQVPANGATGVNIQIINPTVATPGSNINAPCYPSNYYTNQMGACGCAGSNPINGNGVDMSKNPYVSGGLLDPNDPNNPYGADPYNPNNPYRPGGAFDSTNPDNPYKVGASEANRQNPYAPGGKLDPNNPNNPYGADPQNPNNPYRPGGPFDPNNKNNPYKLGLNSPTHPQSPGNPYRPGGPLDPRNPNNPFGKNPNDPNNPYRPGGPYDPTNPNSEYKIIDPMADPNNPSNPYRPGGPLDPNDKNNPYGANPNDPNNPYRPGGAFDPMNPNNKYGAGGLLDPKNPISPYYNSANANNTNNVSNKVEDDKKKTEKKKVVLLTDDYIKSLENCLNSHDKSIRLNAAKDVFARLDEDPSRKDDKALIALINKMLQDPCEEIKIHAIAALEGRICNGDQLTVQLLQQMQQTDGGYGQDAIDANKILLQMAGQTVDKEVPIDDLKRTKFKSPEFSKDSKSKKKG